jgi:hypothetical protein
MRASAVHLQQRRPSPKSSLNGRWRSAAVYDRHTNPKLPYFLQTIAHTCTTETLVHMRGSLSEKPSWLQKIAARRPRELARHLAPGNGEPPNPAHFVKSFLGPSHGNTAARFGLSF